MKKLIFIFLLLCSFLNIFAQSSPLGYEPNHLDNLIERWKTLDKSQSKSILQEFTLEELTLLRSYLAVQNPVDLNLGGTQFKADPVPVTNAYGYEYFQNGVLKFSIEMPSFMTYIGPGDQNEYAGAINPMNPEEAYTVRYDGSFHAYNFLTTEYTYLGNFGFFFEELAFNPVNNNLYGITMTGLYLIDPLTVTATHIGNLQTASLPLGFTINGEGNAYLYDEYDVFYSVNLATGAASPIGYVGFDAAFSQSMSWDPQTNTIYMAAFNYGTLFSELRSVNVENGMSTLIGNIGTSVAEFYWVSFVTESVIPSGNCDTEGNTTIGLNWNRPLENGGGISDVNTKYRVYGPFVVDQSGDYTITSHQINWNGMIFLYKDNFDAANPLTNFVAGNDDFGNDYTSQIISNLEVDTTYYIVTTGSQSNQNGAYSLEFSGPGVVSCEYIEEPKCDWTLIVEGQSYGHFISWAFKRGDMVLLSGGQYITNGFYDYKQISFEGPVDFTIFSEENELGGSATYIIIRGTEIIATGTIIPGESKSVNNLSCFGNIDGCAEAPNGQFPETEFTPNCSGNPEIITNSAKTGEYTLVNLAMEKDYVFSSSVATDQITLTNEDGTVVYAVGTGSLNFISGIAQKVRFYLHLDDECAYDGTYRTKSIECQGILGPPENDICTNAFAINCGETATGNTYFATNNGGNNSKDVFYKFTGNGTPEFVNLSLCNSSYDTFLRVYTDCSLSEQIAYNDNFCSMRSELNFYSDGVTTYYIMIEGAGNNMGAYELKVSCSEIPEYEPCSLAFESTPTTGVGIYSVSESGRISANDFDVLADTQLELNKITIQILSSHEPPISYNLKFYEGETSVGNQVGPTFNNLYPTAMHYVGTYNSLNYAIYEIELTLPETTIFPAYSTQDKKYWVGISGNPGQDSQYVHWASFIKFSPYTLPPFTSIDNGASWYQYDYGDQKVESIMQFEGECKTLGLEDVPDNSFSYYPNPTQGTLTIQSSLDIQNIEIFNLTGQKLISNAKLTNSQLNISFLPKGSYIVRVTLENGKVETFKIIKT